MAINITVVKCHFYGDTIETVIITATKHRMKNCQWLLKGTASSRYFNGHFHSVVYTFLFRLPLTYTCQIK